MKEWVKILKLRTAAIITKEKEGITLPIQPNLSTKRNHDNKNEIKVLSHKGKAQNLSYKQKT